MQMQQPEELLEGSSPLGSLFHQIISDMKNGAPIWEDFIAKASKLHAALKFALSAISAYLDAFQKIADAATNARGATKDIGTALTRMCLRHRAMETRMKTFISTIMDCLVNQLQEKLEDWKKSLIILDKDHTREYKRARSELKKRSTDTLRLQKKVKKGKAGDLQRRMETCMQDINERKQILEDAEKKAVRAALIEERTRFCSFVTLLKPVVDSEVAMLSEMSHLQEGTGQLLKHTTEPHTLPAASEQVISDLQNVTGIGMHWTPPSSPPSPCSLGLGNRKSSSLCSSISSLNSSSSGSNSGSSSTHHLQVSGSSTLPGSASTQPLLSHVNKSLIQPLRLGSLSSRDSGFTSQDTLHPSLVELPRKASDNTSAASSCTTPIGNPEISSVNFEGSEGKMLDSCLTSGDGSATWPDLKDTLQFERAASAIMSDRPHTISTAYEKGHSRPALSVHTFTSHSVSETTLGESSSPSHASPTPSTASLRISNNGQNLIYARPPLPTRCSSLERPNIPSKVSSPNGLPQENKHLKPSPIPHHLIKDVPQATYVNMFELASMAANRAQALHSTFGDQNRGNVPDKQIYESSASESSLESSSGYGSQGQCPIDERTGNISNSDGFECDLMTNNSVKHEESMTNSIGECGLFSSISLCNVEETVRNVDEVNTTLTTFTTVNKIKPSIPKRRPFSMTVTSTSTNLRMSTSMRRGSAGGVPPKPPPPVRRNSSISKQPMQNLGYDNNECGATNQVNTQKCEDSLPPPPEYLLNPTESHQGDIPRSSTSVQGKGINVAETVKALTELKHTPASPNFLRRNSGISSVQSVYHGSNVTTPTGQSQVLSSFQQSKANILMKTSNMNPIYGPTGFKMIAPDQNSSFHTSKHNSFTNISANSGLFGESDISDEPLSTRIVTNKKNSCTSLNITNTSPKYTDSTKFTFGPSKNQAPSMYGHTTYVDETKTGNQSDRKHSGSIYAQPSQIIAGFNNLGFSGNRNLEGNLSPMTLRKVIAPPRSQSADRRGSDYGSGGLIAAISARLAPQLSPRNTRRSVSNEPNDSISNSYTESQTSNFRTSQDSLSSFNQSYGCKNPASVQPAFLDKLSATLRQRQASTGSPNKAFVVRQLINMKAQPDPRVVHGSLMEQIKRGATLKRNKHCNDRSAPKIR